MMSFLLALLLTIQIPTDTGKIVLLNISAKTKHTDENLVIRTSGLLERQIYTPSGFRSALASAIRKIYELGLFSQVRAETTMLADGVKLTFILEEYPKLKNVGFEGYRRVKKKDLQTKVKFKEGEILTAKKIFDWEQEILKFYKEKGILLVKLST
ncbi:MAG: POTRA domain-containing protein, partial [candidate division WOR-3 bacterium]